MKKYLQLLRPQQWTKNAFVFLPVFFGGKVTDYSSLVMALIAFISFSLAASAIYCINDIRDAEADRLHPGKCRRPIAAGTVSARAAAALSIILMLCAVGIPLLVNNLEVSVLIATYIILNIAYCFKLKQIAIVDVMIIAMGFVLRVAVGGVICNVWLSPWIVSMTFLLTLFLAFAKRRDDVVIRESSGILVRKNIAGYNLPFLNQVLSMLATMSMVCYILYCISPEVESRFDSHYIYITAVFVLAGILRYMQLSLVDSKSGSPTKILLDDRFLQACILCWLVSFFAIIYI